MKSLPKNRGAGGPFRSTPPRPHAQSPKRGPPAPAPPLPDIALMWDVGEKKRWWRYALTALAGAAAGAGILNWLG